MGRPPNADKARRTAAETAVDTANIMQSAAFQRAVAEAVSVATADIVARLEAARAKTGHAEPSAGADQSLARNLALEIARVADSGSKTKRIAPEELERREQATERMLDLIVHNRADGIAPMYRLKREVYLDEVLVRPTWTDPNSHRQMRTEIEWPNVPNEAMEPANQAARSIMEAFIDSIGGKTENLDKQDRVAGGLKVKAGPQAERDAPPVSGARSSDLKIVGRGVQGEVTETAVLGTLAPRARHVA